MDGPFGFEVWRQHRDDLLREAEQSRLARSAREGNRRARMKTLLNGLVEKFNGKVLRPESGNVVVQRGAGRNRRCKSKAA